jgi:energy-coupling factor transport system permease protein
VRSPRSGDDPIFQFVDGNTAVHRLDPRTKILWLGIVTILAVLIQRPDLLLTLFFLTLIPVVISKVPMHQLKPILFFYAFIFIGTTISQGFFYQPLTGLPLDVLFWLIPPDTPLLGPFTGGVSFTLQGAVYGFIQGFRILSMLNASVTLVMTTPVNRIMAGLRELRLPFTFMFMLTTAVRFVPTIIEEYRTIANALKVRGVAKNPLRLVQYSMSPLILNSVRRCSQLALAAESRAFGSRAERTYYTTVQFGKGDRISWSCIGISSVLLVWLSLAG